jgi:hypothetical protein
MWNRGHCLPFARVDDLIHEGENNALITTALHVRPPTPINTANHPQALMCWSMPVSHTQGALIIAKLSTEQEGLNWEKDGKKGVEKSKLILLSWILPFRWASWLYCKNSWKQKCASWSYFTVRIRVSSVVRVNIRVRFKIRLYDFVDVPAIVTTL